MAADDNCSDWEPAATAPSLTRRRVHVWRAALDAPADRLAALSALLSSAESARAERFRFDIHRRRFIVGRALLRQLLAHYLNIDAGAIEIFKTAQGKPFVKRLIGGSELCFNVSHSHDVALYAFGRDRRVGVDVELRRRVAEQDNIARHFFTQEEHATLMRLSAEQRTAGFFNCWTRKEAYIKGIGQGFAHSLKLFAVSLIPGEPARILFDLKDPLAAQRWALFAMTPRREYVAALAVEKLQLDERPELVCYDHRWG